MPIWLCIASPSPQYLAVSVIPAERVTVPVCGISHRAYLQMVIDHQATLSSLIGRGSVRKCWDIFLSQRFLPSSPCHQHFLQITDPPSIIGFPGWIIHRIQLQECPDDLGHLLPIDSIAYQRSSYFIIIVFWHSTARPVSRLVVWRKHEHS